MPVNPRLSFLWIALLAILCPVGAQRPKCATDPFKDPRHDPCNVLKYIPSNALTGISFSLVILVALIQCFSIWRWGGRYMLAMTIGCYTFALGLGTRFGVHMFPHSQGLLIVEYIFVVLSPCAFIASDYILLGRLARHLRSEQYLLVPARRITVLFVSSDIFTFLVQALGGSMSVGATKLKTIRTASHIFLTGLIMQLISFFIFTCIFIIFLYRLHSKNPDAWSADDGKPWYNDCRALIGAMCLSCVGILIRSVYRTIELSQGYEGHLATSETFFYGLDTLPLFIAIAVYVPFWPGRFISDTFEPSTDIEVETKDSPSSTSTQ